MREDCLLSNELQFGFKRDLSCCCGAILCYEQLLNILTRKVAKYVWHL